jgi:hypothetical protein
VSYAQTAEDAVLSRAFADHEFGFYVDIGVRHPAEDSVTLHFYEHSWRCVDVEPDRELHALFPEVRPCDTNLCAGIGWPRGGIAQPAIAAIGSTLERRAARRFAPHTLSKVSNLRLSSSPYTTIVRIK